LSLCGYSGFVPLQRIRTLRAFTIPGRITGDQPGDGLKFAVPADLPRAIRSVRALEPTPPFGSTVENGRNYQDSAGWRGGVRGRSGSSAVILSSTSCVRFAPQS